MASAPGAGKVRKRPDRCITCTYWRPGPTSKWWSMKARRPWTRPLSSCLTTVATTSPNGCQSPHKADWTVLSGREVLIWPDADKAGRAYAEAVATLALKAGAASVHILNLTVFGQVPPGWDAADALAEGWTAEQVTAIVRNPANWLTPASDGVIEHLLSLIHI